MPTDNINSVVKCHKCKEIISDLSVEILEKRGWDIKHIGMGKHVWFCPYCTYMAKLDAEQEE